MKPGNNNKAEINLHRRDFLKISAAFCGVLVLPACGGGSSTSKSPTTPTVQSDSPPSITAHPTSTEVIAGNTASFSVTATGTAPLTYQWRRNGQDISGAITSTLVLAAIEPNENGDVFTVVVSNNAGSLLSQSAQLTVLKNVTTIDSRSLTVDSVQITVDSA